MRLFKHEFVARDVDYFVYRNEDQTRADIRALRKWKTMLGPWYQASRKRGDQALILSNRGVLRAITGDAERARRDFELAVKLHKELPAAAGNLARLDGQTTGTVSSL